MLSNENNLYGVAHEAIHFDFYVLSLRNIAEPFH